MQYNKLLLEEKGKVLNLIKKKYIKIDFSKLTSIAENNLSYPRWMDIYILIYKIGLAPDIVSYDILLNKLSRPVLKLNFECDGNCYVLDANKPIVDLQLWYLINNNPVEFYAGVKYIPKKEYVRELLKFSKFESCGIFLDNVDDCKFNILPINYRFDNVDDAIICYNKVLDAYEAFKSLKLTKENFITNFSEAVKHGKDKRMLATISNILSYFDLHFELKENYITLKDSSFRITNEKEADGFQVKLIDAYQFFRNIVNTENKKDIVSEVYNRKLDENIRQQFEIHVNEYFNILKDQELVDWIITISKESKYTLNITFDDQGVFYINDSVITSSLEAKEFYIEFMDSKKEKLAMTIYKNNIITRIKNIWNKFRAKFVKT